jgi:hypothetical protein
MHGSGGRRCGGKASPPTQPLLEMTAANLRSLLAAYAGEIQWPGVPMPVARRDRDHVAAARQVYRQAALDLALAA